MSRSLPHAAAWLAVATVAAGCAVAPPAQAPTPSVSGPLAKCDQDARQLLDPVDVFAVPAHDAALVARLAAGRYVYRCEERGDWLAVMFPAPGEKVDCAAHQEPSPCLRGWVRRSTRLLTIGSAGQSFDSTRRIPAPIVKSSG